jgi:hypothetical protein
LSLSARDAQASCRNAPLSGRAARHACQPRRGAGGGPPPASTANDTRPASCLCSWPSACAVCAWRPPARASARPREVGPLWLAAAASSLGRAPLPRARSPALAGSVRQDDNIDNGHTPGLKSAGGGLSLRRGVPCRCATRPSPARLWERVVSLAANWSAAAAGRPTLAGTHEM